MNGKQKQTHKPLQAEIVVERLMSATSATFEERSERQPKAPSVCGGTCEFISISEFLSYETANVSAVVCTAHGAAWGATVRLIPGHMERLLAWRK